MPVLLNTEYIQDFFHAAPGKDCLALTYRNLQSMA